MRTAWALHFSVIAFTLLRPSSANTINVGGDAGWNLNFNPAWVSPPAFVGDMLNFSYNPALQQGSYHDVFLFKDYNAYINCDFTRATNVGNGSGVFYKIPSVGTFYFGCSVGFHCASGMTVTIRASLPPTVKAPPAPEPPLPAAGTARRRRGGPNVSRSGQWELIHAIRAANQFALSCKDKGIPCLGANYTLTLKQDVILTRRLPRLCPGAFLVIQGKCRTGGGSYSRCVIDGGDKYPVFLTWRKYQAPTRLILSDLVVQRAKGGVFLSFWGSIIAERTAFFKNLGVERSVFAKSSTPPRYFSHCDFIHNRGTAIFAAARPQPHPPPATPQKQGRGTWQFRSCLFKGNSARKDRPDGGAVFLAGTRLAAFSDVKFFGNFAGRSGGAVFAYQTQIKFRSVSFVRNHAKVGSGGAVAGAAGLSAGLALSFCSSVFKGNIAKHSLNGPSVYLSNNPVEAAGKSNVTAAFCDTASPFTYEPRLPNLNVVWGHGGECRQEYC